MMWDPALYLTFGIGLLCGSFFNVCIYRLPREEQVVSGRSHCPSCKKLIPWYWNIPVLGFLFLRGRCAECKKAISWQYPLVELLTGLLFAGCYAWDGLGYFFGYHVTFLSLLLMISVVDLEHRIIPDELSLGGIVLGFLFSFWHPNLLWWHSAIGLLAGGGAFLAVAVLYEKFAKQEGLGGGDIKLLAMIGAWLGFEPLLLVVASASILGSIYGVAVMLLQKKNAKTAIPYGPFLAVGAVLGMLFQRQFLEFLLPN